jgi:hypothetical protein
MNSNVSGLSIESARRSLRSPAEHRFYVGFSVVMAAAVLLGFARTFFLRAWFPEWVHEHAPPELYFLFHGTVFALWFLLLIVQPSLIAAGRVNAHQRLGRFGAGLAVAVVVAGTIGALLAARRPGGFIDVPMPPLQFLTIPLSGLALFAIFVTLGIVNRRNPQSHKRYMLLSSVALIEAAVVRWPFAIMTVTLPEPYWDIGTVFADLFLLPIVVWDLASRGRVHPVTLWGGLAVIASQPLRMMLSQTHAWQAFAGWAVGLLGA